MWSIEVHGGLSIHAITSILSSIDLSEGAMSCNGDKKVHVLFVGRKPGIYFRWNETYEQVNQFSKSCHDSYRSYDETEHAYVDFCLRHGSDPRFILLQGTFIQQDNMQFFLKKLCIML